MKNPYRVRGMAESVIALIALGSFFLLISGIGKGDERVTFGLILLISSLLVGAATLFSPTFVAPNRGHREAKGPRSRPKIPSRKMAATTPEKTVL
ncbi:hypothetical protein K2X30_14785 [bacterium]|nr:hypothetical protein [bacterium]